MASAGTEELGCTYRGSRRKLKAAILESTVVKVRKVWGAGRMALECQRPRPAKPGSEAEFLRLADEVAKR